MLQRLADGVANVSLLFFVLEQISVFFMKQLLKLLMKKEVCRAHSLEDLVRRRACVTAFAARLNSKSSRN